MSDYFEVPVGDPQQTGGVKNYKPCDKCGDDQGETIEWSGIPLCEECYNAWYCGCEVCVKNAVSEWQKDNEEVAR